jgi:hypothetical protein
MADRQDLLLARKVGDLRQKVFELAAIAGLHKLAHARGIAIVVIHHVRKMEADDPFDMVSGTNGLRRLNLPGAIRSQFHTRYDRFFRDHREKA